MMNECPQVTIERLTAENAALKERCDDMEKAYYDESKKNMALEAQLAAAKPVLQWRERTNIPGLVHWSAWHDFDPKVSDELPKSNEYFICETRTLYTAPPQHAASTGKVLIEVDVPEGYSIADVVLSGMVLRTAPTSFRVVQPALAQGDER